MHAIKFNDINLYSLNLLMMFKHTFKLFFRDLLNNKIYYLINLLGLSAALASAFLILLFVFHEINFDRFHLNRKDIYRINLSLKYGNNDLKLASASIPMKPYLINDFPEIKKVARVFNGKYWGDGQLIKIGENWVKEDHFMFVDNEFFEIFTYPVIGGKKSGELLETNTVLISEKAALKYFGERNPVGKIITVKNNSRVIDYTIVSVFKDIPSNSTFQANFIADFRLVEPRYENRGWNASNFMQYILLDKNADGAAVEKKINRFFEKKHPDKTIEYSLQNILDVYFGSDGLDWYSLAQGNEKTVRLFSIISILIILIACINYMVLSTAKGVSRNLEIGIRKVVGANRKDIIYQILTETFVFIFIVLPFALMASELLLPLINHLLNRNMEIRYFENVPYLLGIIGILVIVGLLSSSYISQFLSRFKPEDILKRRFTAKHGKSLFRKTLISLQLMVFVILLIFSGVIIHQIKFVQRSNIGYSADKLLTLVPPHRHDIFEYDGFVNGIKPSPFIESVTQVASGIFSSTQGSRNISSLDNPENVIQAEFFAADHSFLETFGFNLIKGRGFNPENVSDNNKFILNETAAKELGIEVGANAFIKFDDETAEIIGIVKDFHIGSLHEKIPPLLIGLNDGYFINLVVLKYKPGAPMNQVIDLCMKNWEENGKGGTLNYYFNEDRISQLYDDDKKFGDTIVFFTVLAILIASLGLYGISLFISKQRNKEAGIHKTFGAKFGNIFMLISKEFLILAILANIISFPIAFKLSQNWLMNYSYRINFPLIIPLAVMVLSVIFIVLVVGVNAIKVAKQNPADIIRYE